MAQPALKTAASTAATDARIGRYEVLSILGQGGMGRVYRARDGANGEEVALKLLDLQTPAAVAMFEREYHTLSAIDHPSVVSVFDFGRTEDGRRYFTMELVEGQDLYALSPVPWETLCGYLREVAGALSLLHARGLVHRDISPRNIRIDEVGRVRLLDFGALSAFGETEQLIGTPVCTAPEAVRRMPLDQRADLYSLGVTAYIGLTRKRPFGIKQWTDCENAWLSRPTALPQLVADLPPGLDELLQALMSVDFRERPASAANVIERLEMIAGLEEEKSVSMAHGHLASPQLIGRQRELRQLRQHLERAMRGTGVAVAIEGTARVGRTRLTHDLAVDARLLGAATLRIDGSGTRESGTLARGLLRGLLDTVSGEAVECLSGFPILAQAFEELRRARTWSDPAPSQSRISLEAMEAHADVLAALVRWIVEISYRRPLVVVIDDAHALDYSSAGLLFGLAHACTQARMLVVFTLEEKATPPKAVQQAVRVASRIKLRGLTEEGIGDLVRSVFGDVPHAARLSTWLAEVAEGNPGHSLDLLGSLVASGTIRWFSGAWSVPKDLSRATLPSTLGEALAGRLQGLSGGQLRLARLLALHRGGAPLSVCQRLFPGKKDSGRVFKLLDDLVSKQVASMAGQNYRIVQEALRSAILEGAGPSEMADLHRAMGDALLQESEALGPLCETSHVSQIGTALQAGWHLLHGGEGAQGRELLRTAGLLLTHRGDGLTEAVPALEAALSDYVKSGRSKHEQAYLMTPLCLAGSYLDFRLTYRYADPLLDAMADSSGVGIAQRLQRYLPGKLALGLGLLTAIALRPFTDRRLTTRSFRENMLGLIGLATATLGTYSALTDKLQARATLARLEPLRYFPDGHPARLAHEFQIALKECAEGDYAASVSRARSVLAVLGRPGGVPGLPEDARIQFVAGLLIVIGSIDTYRTDGRVHETLDSLDRMFTSLSRESAAGIRANYYAGRGEFRKSAQARELVDVLAAQGGSPWRQDVLMPRCLWWVEAQCEDSLGLRRSVRQLEALTHDCEALVPAHAAAHAVYLADRGLPAEALQRYEAILVASIADANPLTMRFVGAYARVLRLAGRAQQALELCTDHLSRLDAAEMDLTCLVHGAQLERGLSLIALGELEQAASYLDSICEAQSHHDNPLIHTLSHRARAQAAIAQHDREAFGLHMAVAQQWSQRADNPALFGLLQRTIASARAHGLAGNGQGADAQHGSPSNGNARNIAQLMSACRGPAQRQQTALDLLVDRAQAAHGFLYLLESEALRFAAPQQGAEPPEELGTELFARLSAFRDLDDDTLATLFDDGETPLQTRVGSELDKDPVSRGEARLGSPYRPVFLAFEQQGALEVVGVVALVEGAMPLRVIDAETVQAVALGIYEAGDATVMR